MKRSIFLLAIFVLLTACGKKEAPTEPTQPPREVDMIFAPTDEETVTAKESTNLRDYPSQGDDSEIIHVLQNGETALRTGISDSGWSMLTYEGMQCYAVSSFLTTDLDYTTPTTEATDAPIVDDGINTVFNPVVEDVTAKDLVNLRSIPSVTNPDSEVVAQLHNGEVLKRVGVSDNGWSRLIYQDWVVYAASNYLTTNLGYTAGGELLPEDEGITTRFTECVDEVTPKIEVNLRAKPSVTDADAAVVATVKNGTPIHRTGVNEDLGWSRVEYEGKVLYCVSQYLQPYHE